MTLWSARSVLGFITTARWPKAELTEALATCWAASEGDDALQLGTGLPNGTRWVGLWQIPVGPDTPDTEVAGLFDPVRCTQVAHTLWTNTGAYDWTQSRTPLALRKAWYLARSTVASGPGATVLEADVGTSAAHPPGSSATFGPGGLHARLTETIAAVIATRTG